jgi:hypothetical protein
VEKKEVQQHPQNELGGLQVPWRKKKSHPMSEEEETTLKANQGENTESRDKKSRANGGA